MFTDLLVRLTGQLTGGWLNILVASHSWIVPALQTVHILGVAIVLSGVLLINLRVAGLIERDQPIAAILDLYLAPVTVAVAVLALTGLLLIAGEPTRAVFRTIFWAKMALILVALGLTWSHRLGMRRAGIGRIGITRFGITRFGITRFADGAIAAAPARRIIAFAALAAWLAAIVAGRWIAYVDAWPGAPT